MGGFLEAAVILTYRCTFKCRMCSIWQFPSEPGEEITLADIEKLPGNLSFCNLTGGEPFMRDDIEGVVAVMRRKSRRIVISTNGWFTGKIVDLARRFPDVGVRVSIEGMAEVNDELRGVEGGYDRGLQTLLELRKLGTRDIGFGITVSDANHGDMLELYRVSKEHGFEFATAAVHNSFYFHKKDNEFRDPEQVVGSFKQLIGELLATGRVKNWYRAYFNYGIINYVRGRKRILPCEAGTESFFVSPNGDVVPCNGSDEPMVMGNIKTRDWDEIWHSSRAEEIREKVRNCPRNCWMIGTAAPVIRKYKAASTSWVLKNKIRQILGKRLSMPSE